MRRGKHITRKQRAVENYVACRDSQQIGLFKSDMVRYLPYYKAYAIVTPMPESSTSMARAGVLVMLAVREPRPLSSGSRSSFRDTK